MPVPQMNTVAERMDKSLHCGDTHSSAETIVQGTTYCLTDWRDIGKYNYATAR